MVSRAEEPHPRLGGELALGEVEGRGDEAGRVEAEGLGAGETARRQDRLLRGAVHEAQGLAVVAEVGQAPVGGQVGGAVEAAQGGVRPALRQRERRASERDGGGQGQ